MSSPTDIPFVYGAMSPVVKKVCRQSCRFWGSKFFVFLNTNSVIYSFHVVHTNSEKSFSNPSRSSDRENNNRSQLVDIHRNMGKGFDHILKNFSSNFGTNNTRNLLLKFKSKFLFYTIYSKKNNGLTDRSSSYTFVAFN